MHYFIGMDVGGTNARIKFADKTGKEIGTFTGDGATITSSSYENTLQKYKDLICPALEKLSLSPKDCIGLCIGASGVDTPKLKEDYITIFETIGFDRNILKVYNDCELLLHIIPQQPCVALVAGTGSIVMGRDQNGNMDRYGGWSYLISDEGSASHIVRKALEEILKHMDGANHCAILTEDFIKESGLITQQDIATHYFENTRNKERITCFAPIVDQAAKKGDAVSLDILNQAAKGMFDGACVVVEKLGIENAPFTIVFWGSVLVHSEKVKTTLKDMLEDRFPNANIIYPQSSALDIALDIAQK